MYGFSINRQAISANNQQALPYPFGLIDRHNPEKANTLV
jgi:hypothetical protein